MNGRLLLTGRKGQSLSKLAPSKIATTTPPTIIIQISNPRSGAQIAKKQLEAGGRKAPKIWSIKLCFAVRWKTAFSSIGRHGWKVEHIRINENQDRNDIIPTTRMRKWWRKYGDWRWQFRFYFLHLLHEFIISSWIVHQDFSLIVIYCVALYCWVQNRSGSLLSYEWESFFAGMGGCSNCWCNNYARSRYLMFLIGIEFECIPNNFRYLIALYCLSGLHSFWPPAQSLHPEHGKAVIVKPFVEPN